MFWKNTAFHPHHSIALSKKAKILRIFVSKGLKETAAYLRRQAAEKRFDPLNFVANLRIK